MAQAPLDPRDRELLEFERDWRLHEGRKEVAIREQFGVSPARYYQLLNRVLDHPEAAAADPLTVRRLRKRREERLRRRAAGELGERRGR